MKTFSEIVDNIAIDLQDTTTVFKTAIKRYVNKRYLAVLRAVNWDNIRMDYTATVGSGTQDVVLPSDCKNILTVTDVTNDLKLSHGTIQDIDTDEPGTFSDTGSSDTYIVLQKTVQGQPSVAATVSVVSTSATDDGSVYVRGYSSGVMITETLTLNGTTPVVSTNSYTRFESITMTDYPSGKVTATSDSVTIAVLGPRKRTSDVKVLRVHKVSNTAISLSIKYAIGATPLISDGDIPVLDIGDLLETGGRADGYKYKRKGAKAAAENVLFQTELADYIFDMENRADGEHMFTPVTFDPDNLI